MNKIKYLVFLAVIPLLFSCNQQAKNNNVIASQDATSPKGSYGKLITTDYTISAGNLIDLMADKDSLKVKLTGEVVAYCQRGVVGKGLMIT